MEMQTIYVQLLDEGTKVYRPVPAIKIQDDVYELQGAELYDRNMGIRSKFPCVCKGGLFGW